MLCLLYRTPYVLFPVCVSYQFVCISLVSVLLLATVRPLPEYHGRAIMRSVVEGFPGWRGWGGLWCLGISEEGALKGTGELSWISEEDRNKKEIEHGMRQEVNLGRKSLLVLKKPLLCHMLGLRISIGAENHYASCRLYRTVLLIYALFLSLYIITIFAALAAYKSQKNSCAGFSVFSPLFPDYSFEVSRCCVCTNDNTLWFLQP